MSEHQSQNSQNKNLTKLKYQVIKITSADTDKNGNSPKLSKLLQGHKWISERFCVYPQEIIIKFNHPVDLYQINLLSHEKKISKRISFYSFCPKESEINDTDNTNLKFDEIGFVDLNDNTESNYKVRENKKIFIHIKTLYINYD